MKYYRSKIFSLGYDEAVARTKAALQEEGFGVLTEIDVKATFKKKLDADFRRYIILGACNPTFAFKALQAEPNIGLLLPCNVVVQDREDGTAEISAIDPTVAMQVVDNSALEGIARDVKIRLCRALDSI